MDRRLIMRLPAAGSSPDSSSSLPSLKVCPLDHHPRWLTPPSFRSLMLQAVRPSIDFRVHPAYYQLATKVNSALASALTTAHGMGVWNGPWTGREVAHCVAPRSTLRTS